MRELRHLANALTNRALWLAFVVSLLLAAAAYQLPFQYDLNLGSQQAGAYITNFYPPQDIEGRAARWSHAYSYIRLPGTGGNRALQITLDFNTSRAGAENPRPINVRAFVGGEELFRGALPPLGVWRTMTLRLDNTHLTALAARDLVIEIRTDVYRPPDYQGNELGVLVSNLKVEPLPGAAWQPVVPNVRVMLLLGLLVLGVYLLTSRLFALASSGRTLPSLFGAVPALLATAAGLLVAVAIASDVVGLSPALQPLVASVVAAYVLLLAGIYLLPSLLPGLRDEGRVISRALNYRPLFALVLAAPILLSFGFQAPLALTLDIGSGHDTPYLRDFNPPMFPMPDGSPGDYRFTSARSVVLIPGAGSDNVFRVTMRLNPGASARGPVRVLMNNSELARVQLVPGWQDVSFEATSGPARVFSPSDLELEIRAPAEVVEGGEQRGVMLDRVTVRLVRNLGAFTTSPAHEAGLILALALLYLLVCRSAGLHTNLPSWRLGALSGLAALVTLMWALRVQRADVALALPHLLLTLGAGYLLLIGASHLLARPTTAGHISRFTFHNLLATIFATAFMLRYGFSALPQFNVIDLPYHLKWLRILIDGDFGALYFPGQLSSVPPEWSLDVLIPKSPLFYVAVWPLGLLRGVDLGSAMLFVVSLLDAAMVFAMYALVARLSPRWAIWSAGLYALMPLAFRSFAFGILPTIFAQALTLLVMAWPTVRPFDTAERHGMGRRYVVFGGWVVLLAASLIAFPTALAFNSFVLVLLALGWFWWEAAPRSNPIWLLGGLAAALTLSFAVYYGLYVGPILTRTLPSLAGGTSIRGKEIWPGGPAEMVGWTAGYLVNWLPWFLLPLALALLWLRGSAGRAESRALARRLGVLMLAWLLVLLGGMLLNLRFDMIGKHLYYTMPAAALAGGLVLSRLAALRAGQRYSLALACLAGLSVAWAALAFMAGRL